MEKTCYRYPGRPKENVCPLLYYIHISITMPFFFVECGHNNGNMKILYNLLAQILNIQFPYEKLFINAF